MDAFNYLSVLLSIIIGLGITQVLTAAGRLIRGRARVVAYWPPLLWAAVLIVIYVQVWWSMFELRSHADWTFLSFLAVLTQTVTLYMMAALVLPETVDEEIDLRAHYERHSSWFFGFFIATVLVSLVKELLLDGRLPDPVNLFFHLLLIAISVSAILVRRPRYHQVLAVGGAVTIAAYVGLLFARLR